MFKKAQGLMSEEEARALLNKYKIYVLAGPTFSKISGEVIDDKEFDRDDEVIRLGIGDEGAKNILFYTIDPVDYNILMRKQTKPGERLFVTFPGANTFSFDKFFMQVIIYHPIKELKQMGFGTSSKEAGISKNVTEKNIDTIRS